MYMTSRNPADARGRRIAGRPTALTAARPRGSRGILGLILGALAVGNAIYKGVSGNQRKQRNKGYIEENYQAAKQKVQRHQENVRQGTLESLEQRGLAQGGLSPIQRAMASNGQQTPNVVPGSGIKGIIQGVGQMAAADSPQGRVPVSQAGTPHTLGEQLQVDNDKQFGLEQLDLEHQRSQAERENKADYIDTLVGAVTSGVTGGLQAYGASKELAAMKAPEGGASASPIHASMTGVDNPGNWWGGIHGGDPLNAEGSSWNRDRTVSGAGLTNDLFHVG
jgi:hypothetical protein